MYDEIDIEILRLLQQNARIRNADIARQLDMAASAILERIRKLESRGLIRGYETSIDPEKVGFGLLAYVFVRSDELPDDETTGRELTEIPEVLEVHHVAGEDCYLAKVRCRDTAELGCLLRSKFGRIESIRSTNTTIVLGTLKDTPALPLELPVTGDEGDRR